MKYRTRCVGFRVCMYEQEKVEPVGGCVLVYRVAVCVTCSSPSQPDKTLEEKKKTKRRRQYVLRGSCSALAIQLFAIDERYEMR